MIARPASCQPVLEAGITAGFACPACGIVTGGLLIHDECGCYVTPCCKKHVPQFVFRAALDHLALWLAAAMQATN